MAVKQYLVACLLLSCLLNPAIAQDPPSPYRQTLFCRGLLFIVDLLNCSILGGLQPLWCPLFTNTYLNLCSKGSG